MNNKTKFIAGFTSIICVLLVNTPAQARMKCWTNNEGVRECGDKVPPEFAQQGHQEIGKSGIVTKETDRAKTPEELEEKKRLAKLEQEKLAIEAEQKEQDDILLKTFTSVDDIKRARDNRISAIESTIKLTDTRIKKIQADMDKRIASAAADERAGKVPSEALLKDIDSLQRQITDNNKFIEDKRAEQEVIRESHALDIARYKKLKGIE